MPQHYYLLDRGGGGTPLYGLYRYVPRDRVWFLEVLDPYGGSKGFFVAAVVVKRWKITKDI